MDEKTIKRNQTRRQYFAFLIQVVVTVASFFAFWFVITPYASIAQILGSIALWVVVLMRMIWLLASYPYERQRSEREVKQHYKKSLI